MSSLSEMELVILKSFRVVADTTLDGCVSVSGFPWEDGFIGVGQISDSFLEKLYWLSGAAITMAEVSVLFSISHVGPVTSSSKFGTAIGSS